MERARLVAGLKPSDEELYRAYLYRLMARLLGAPCDAELLEFLRGLESDGSELGRALANLAEVARKTDVTAAANEYDALFIGITRGELVPFESYYLTGALNEKPLAELRADMAQLGIARSEDFAEPEDHVASLFEIMDGMITGRFGKAVPLAEQHRFFETHIACWVPNFFADLEAAESARLFMPLARIGTLFMEVETEAFAMAA